MMLNSATACKEYLKENSAETIARQLQHDQELCEAQKLPSILALYLPSPGSDLANAIFTHLRPESVNYPRSIRVIQYAGIVQGIKACLSQISPQSQLNQTDNSGTEVKGFKPTAEEVETTLKVLQYYVRNQKEEFGLNISVENVIKHLQESLHINKSSRSPNMPSKLSVQPEISTRWTRKCYICQFILATPHPQYASLCKQCGDFNLASCSLSLPGNLKLDGKTALVTGGRLNLGFHTALRLLRCGARVIVSTRYPRDAEIRYLTEKDSRDWLERLKVIGADFRAASDVFHLVVAVKNQLKFWDENREGKLDILINNAAQTLTDSVEKEAEAVKNEQKLLLNGTRSNINLLFDENGYRARVRGDILNSKALGIDQEQRKLEGSVSESNVVQAHQEFDDNMALAIKSSTPEKSSWMQSLNEIPYEDFISAHSVNTFVPLILTREFLPLMGSPPSVPKKSKPLAYIVNVTSREGIFESSPGSSSKSGHHIHTNMTKAALNMLTETEAGSAWKERRVAMNSVDPGYMSAAPEIEAQWKRDAEGVSGRGRRGCPIGWEDGAGRVLWPVAIGERGEGAVWGRLLKHFGAVEVDVGVGR